MDQAIENFYKNLKQRNPKSTRGPIAVKDLELEISEIRARQLHPKTKYSYARVSYLPIFKRWGNLTFDK